MGLEVFGIPDLATDGGSRGALDGESGPSRVERSGASVRVLPKPDEAGGGPAELEPDAGPEVFERVYEEHFAFAWRSLRLLGVADDALEDAAQDVFAVVSRQLSDFAGRSSLRTWLFAIVQRTAANYRRRHRRKQRPLVPLGAAVLGSEPTPQAHAEAAEVAQRIESFCEALPPDRRALFVLALLEELPAPEIAAALGIPLNTVYSRVRSLRAGLERALGRGEGHDE